MSTEVILAGIAIALLAASCQAVSGFGFALVMTPLLVLFWDVKATVATSILLGVLINIPLLREVRGTASLGRVPGLLLGFVIGLGPGVLLLERLDANALRILVAVVVMTASVLMYFAPALGRGDDRLSHRVLAGTVSGVIGSSTSLGGPPVVLYLLGREPDAVAFRSTLLVYFLIASTLRLLVFVAFGQITSDVLLMSSLVLPAMAIGIAGGVWVRRRLHGDPFRRVVLAILVATSLAVFTGAVVNLA